jgi:hypothetical protein
MATDPEALAQLSRLLGDALPPAAPESEVQAAVEGRFQRLIDGLVAEAAASDDVYDRDSAYEFVEARLTDLEGWLTEQQTTRLRDAVRRKIEAW